MNSKGRRPHGPARFIGLLVCLLVPLLSAVSFSPVMARAAALTVTSLSVTPSSGLVDNQQVRVRVSGGTYGTTYVVAECDPKALLLLLDPGASPQDDCESRTVGIMTVAADGSAEVAMHLPALLTTALGGADCRKTACFLAVYAVHYLGGARLLAHPLSFAPDACAAQGSCGVPADAWDPSLGPVPPGRAAVKATHQAGVASRKATERQGASGPTIPVAQGAAGTAGAAGTGGRTPGAPSAHGRVVSVATPISVALHPVSAGDLSLPGSVTGPYDGALLTAPSLTSTAVTIGEGLLRVALESPSTSWGPGNPSSTVVDATLEDVTTGQHLGTQQFVLFFGAKPFVYAGFTGPVRATDRYKLTIAVEPPASKGGLSWPLPGRAPEVTLLASALEVVSPTNPAYLAYAYAPVMYGRSTSALHDVPLLTYADQSPAKGGATTLSYVVVWSHEDAGTGFLPFMEWGRWGRMTDIEGAISLTVTPGGKVSKAQYLWGGEPLTGFPDSQSALREVERPFAGAWWGHHPVIRDATGNNDFSDKGTTRFRFLLAPVAAPAAGQLRDAVMDANPWTYSVMANEVARWYTNSSTNPASPAPGTASQYAIIDMSTSGRGISSVAVNLRLAGSAEWYRSDLGWGFPLVGTGHVRTVVKLPVGWSSRRVTGTQVAVEPPSAASALSVHFLHVEAFNGRAVVPVAAPAPSVVPEVLHVQP